jgi:hypothetical protein
VATKTNMNHKELSVSVELEIIKKVVLNNVRHTHTQVGNELSIPVSMLNIMVGKRNITQPGRKKLNACECEKSESWFLE